MAVLFATGSQPPGRAAGPAEKSAGPPLAVVVHLSSSASSLSAADLRRMFLGELRFWPEGSPVVVIEQPDESETQRRMLRMLLRLTPLVYNRQLLQVQFQGKQPPNIKVLNSDSTAIHFVWNVPGAISIVEAAAATASSAHVKILRIDGKLPGEKGYLLQ